MTDPSEPAQPTGTSPLTNPVGLEVLGTIVNRYSPYRFADRDVSQTDLLLCFEAARWAASSFNDQPWSFIVARRQDAAAFEVMTSCLAEANQNWARAAGALVMTICRTTFRQNGKPNRVALHDLGQAAAHFALQATRCGLQVHQMAGINLSKTRHSYSIPDDHDPQTAFAIGYPDLSTADEQAAEFARRERAARRRRPLAEQVFTQRWGATAEWVGSGPDAK